MLFVWRVVLVVFAFVVTLISPLPLSLPSHNELASVVPELCMLTNLQCLKLEYNKLTELPDNIGLLTNLEELDVSHNRLSGLPHSVGRMGHLLKLGATHNELRTLPESIGDLKGNMYVGIWMCSV